MTEHYLEDFTVGQTFGSGRLRVDEEQIRRFASEFDPQLFHLDDQAARDTIFRSLAASGWHTAALTMRLLVESEFKPAGGIIGAGIDELRPPRARDRVGPAADRAALRTAGGMQPAVGVGG